MRFLRELLGVFGCFRTRLQTPQEIFPPLDAVLAAYQRALGMVAADGHKDIGLSGR